MWTSDRGSKFASMPHARQTAPHCQSFSFVGLLALYTAVSATCAIAADPQAHGSGLPVPRFVSLKSDRVNLRSGPGTEYPTSWVFRRAGLPVEVIKEFETWRQVRDAEGATGWILQTLLSGRRTAVIAPWDNKAAQEKKSAGTPQAETSQIALFSQDTTSSRQVALLEPGVVADLQSCDGRWCRVVIENFTGYVEQKKLWGVYEGETIR